MVVVALVEAVEEVEEPFQVAVSVVLTDSAVASAPLEGGPLRACGRPPTKIMTGYRLPLYSSGMLLVR